MTLEEIKSQYAHLPHVKKVWVKGNAVYLVPVAGSEVIDLSTDETQLQDEKPVKPRKNK